MLRACTCGFHRKLTEISELDVPDIVRLRLDLHNIKQEAVEAKSAEEAFAKFTPAELLDLLVKKWNEAATNFNKDKLLPNPWELDWYNTIMWERVL